MISEKTIEKLKQFGRILNEEIENDKVDPIIGRSNEIRRIIEILSRKKKNNPVLIGEAGVGKTAIVEGLAQRIMKRDVPQNLFGKIIFELNISLLLAGAKFQGEFENRLKEVVETVRKNPDILVFIDELHLLIGAGRTQGAIDAANILKPILAQGEMPVIGATTNDEYHQYIEKDAALERRFQQILVLEPTKIETVAILRGLKKNYENFHEVSIRDNALTMAVKLSEQFLPLRRLPDKAIDLIDEACAKIKTEIWSVPGKIDSVKRKVIELTVEKNALNNEEEKDFTVQERLKEVDGQLIVLQQKEKNLTAKWTKEKEQLQKLTDKNRLINNYQKEYDKTVEEGNLKRAGEIRYKILPKLTIQITKLKANIIKNPPELLKSVVDNETVAEIVAVWTKIPVQKLLINEKKSLLELENKIGEIVKGQTNSVKSVANAILRSRLQLNDPNQPIASFLFLGPTGVGKSLIAKVLANLLFSSHKKLIQFNMSEYNTRHSLSRLIGSPPGYVGYEQGGQLTEKIKLMPYSVILFDELEKAHSEVQKILLQILEDGELTDGLGKQISFRNTIIIATSNLGSELIDNNPDFAKEIHEKVKKEMSPELYNRFTEVIIFNRLNPLAINEIIRLELKKTKKLINLNQKLLMEIDDSVIIQIKNSIEMIDLGARPIKHYIQKEILTIISKWLLEEKIKENQLFLLKYDPKLKKYINKNSELN